MHSKILGWRFLAWAAALLLVGCATGDVAMLATIAGGEKIRVPMGRGGVAMTAQDGIKITASTFVLKPAKHLTYVFGLVDTQKRNLQRVRVEDVSDDAPALLLDDAAPKLTASGEWVGESAPLAPTDPKLAWLVTLPNSLRVFRFTITFADGKSLVLLQGTMFPQPLKSAVRQEFGQNY